jgi:alpha-tubulin suppressor-like RCC1 family protein
VAGSGDLKCWGYNGNGQLGIGGTSTQYYPQNVDLGSATGKAKGIWYIKLSTGRARTGGILILLFLKLRV